MENFNTYLVVFIPQIPCDFVLTKQHNSNDIVEIYFTNCMGGAGSWGAGHGGDSGKHRKGQEVGNQMVLPWKLAWAPHCGWIVVSSTQWAY